MWTVTTSVNETSEHIVADDQDHYEFKSWLVNDEIVTEVRHRKNNTKAKIIGRIMNGQFYLKNTPRHDYSPVSK